MLMRHHVQSPLFQNKNPFLATGIREGLHGRYHPVSKKRLLALILTFTLVFTADSTGLVAVLSATCG